MVCWMLPRSFQSFTKALAVNRETQLHADDAEVAEAAVSRDRRQYLWRNERKEKDTVRSFIFEICGIPACLLLLLRSNFTDSTPIYPLPFALALPVDLDVVHLVVVVVIIVDDDDLIEAGSVA